MDNDLINEINKLKALIATLQQQLQTQQTEINSVKQKVSQLGSHWHFVGTDCTGEPRYG
jgi:uncharacterized membrane protein